MADHRPEHMQQWRPAAEVLGRPPARRSAAASAGGGAEAALDASPDALLLPPWLLNPPQRLAVQGNRLKESQASHRAALEQRTQATAEFRARISTELVDAIKKRDATRQELVKANQRWELQTLHAPIDGIVQQLAAQVSHRPAR